MNNTGLGRKRIWKGKVGERQERLCGITPVVGFSNASGRAIYLGQGIITVTDSKWVYFLNNISPQLDCQPEENCVYVCVFVRVCVCC